uniref:Uncharacterized protein n=1 Tax=Glossina palpalis gambiensis TaxID=67801 RepID=A0A1B0C258_9MUSC
MPDTTNKFSTTPDMSKPAYCAMGSASSCYHWDRKLYRLVCSGVFITFGRLVAIDEQTSLAKSVASTLKSKTTLWSVQLKSEFINTRKWMPPTRASYKDISVVLLNSLVTLVNTILGDGDGRKKGMLENEYRISWERGAAFINSSVVVSSLAVDLEELNSVPLLNCTLHGRIRNFVSSVFRCPC